MPIYHWHRRHAKLWQRWCMGWCWLCPWCKSIIVIGITNDVGDDNFESDDGSILPYFCSLNLDDFCGGVGSEFFDWLTSWIKLLTGTVRKDSCCPFKQQTSSFSRSVVHTTHGLCRIEQFQVIIWFVQSGNGGIIICMATSRSHVIGITHDVEDDPWYLIDADDGNNSTPYF